MTLKGLELVTIVKQTQGLTSLATLQVPYLQSIDTKSDGFSLQSAVCPTELYGIWGPAIS